MKFLESARLLTAMVTPMNTAGRVDLERAGQLAQRLLTQGSDGVVVSGTTGESPTLSDGEKVELFRAVVHAVSGKGTVIAGTGTNDTAAAVKLSLAAEEAGADAILVVSPYYNKPDQQGLLAHFSAIAQATTLPVILYNHPGRTGVNIEADTMAELARVPNIIGVKDSSGNLDLVTAYRLAAGPEFVIWSGDDPLTLPYLSVGAYGVISVASHVVGPVIRRMLDAWERGDFLEARRLHEQTYRLSKALFCAPSPAPTKYALAQMGFPVGGVRLPLLSCTPLAQKTLDEVLEGFDLRVGS
ncbi:MAG: 4-hydroxy-tetrahydrodipicolinate synthase [Candidatus Sericytochromatia bacterium]|nr:4-hydroxy-tetrahydrodipicolinate synthase [Candidatus Sericytochromatia bacterium]